MQNYAGKRFQNEESASIDIAPAAWSQNCGGAFRCVLRNRFQLSALAWGPYKRQDELPGQTAPIRRSGTKFCSTMDSGLATIRELAHRWSLGRLSGPILLDRWLLLAG